jgi:threonine/homoserine/homoserine lactone efflux protein
MALESPQSSLQAQKQQQQQIQRMKISFSSGLLTPSLNPKP